MKQMTEQQLRKEAKRIRDALHKIESDRMAKENQAYLGKCFKYRNNYGPDCPGWWLYARVISVGPDMKAFRFEETSTGDFSANRGTYWGFDGWTEIPEKTFLAEWEKFLSKLQAQEKLRK
jgi:hypothetical protein